MRIPASVFRGLPGVFVWLACTACNNSPPERFNAFPEGNVASPLDFCTQQAASACDFASRCDPVDRQALDHSGDCTQAATQRCLRRYSVQVAGIASKRGAWSPREAERCLAALNGRACESMEPTPCQDMFSGAVMTGEGCTWDDECASGLLCSSRNGLACGQCLRKGLLDEACTEHRACQTGLRCHGGFCGRALQVGDACTADPTACADGLHCLSTTGACARVVGVGGSCVRTACAAGLACVTHNQDATCMAPVALGGECSAFSVNNPPCQGEGVRLACTSGLCEAINILASGAPCGEGARCAGDLACLHGVCQPRGAVGAACDVDAGMDGCLESDCVDGICTRRSLSGETCTGSCVGLRCINGVCGTEACDAGIVPDAGMDGGGHP